MSRLLEQMKQLTAKMVGSVRVRVTGTALIAVGCALGVSFMLVDAGMQHYRQRVLTAIANEQAKVVIALNPNLTAPLVLPVDPTIDSGLVQVIRDGRVIGASRLLRRFPPLWSPGDSKVMRTSETLGVLARDVRSVAVPVGRGGSQGVVVVVTSLEQYDHSVAYVRRLLEIGTPMLLVVVGVISWLVVGRALRPIELMRREVDEVASVRSTHRVRDPANDDEVGRLARTLNSMLDRITASTERERRFVSDASHELRSPIANIRTELEVALRHPGLTDWSQVATEVLGQNDRMEDLVEGLLILARSDEGSLPGGSEAVDLSEVVRSVLRSVPSDDGAGPQVRVDLEPAPVSIPAVYLERMVANLVANARRFAGSALEVSVRPLAGQAVLRVIDDGPGVPEADRNRIFERFVRLDEARDRGEGGFGLGLAIVADLSRFYGGRIDVTSADPGAEFVLRLPLAAEEPQQPQQPPESHQTHELPGGPGPAVPIPTPGEAQAVGIPAT